MGKLLPKAKDLPINFDFKPIRCGEDLIELSEEVVQDLSSDQLYAYRMVKAVRSGVLPRELALLQPGPICHSRWLTTGCALLRLWVAEHGLSGELLLRLERIVTFVVTMYFKCWFDIKVKSSWLDGPRHILTALRCLRQQDEVVQEAVTPYIRSGAWFSHSEAVLQTMLCSSESGERQFAVEKILEVREGRDLGDRSFRVMRKPPLNLQATTLEELISWEGAHEPVLTCDLSSRQIRHFIATPMTVPYYPAHTQGVERVVKEVTTASASVFGFDRRDGFIRGRAAHRELMPTFTSKKDLMELQSILSD